ncbi:MAG: hypothetical protein CL609_04800 [Anaerolineaceae bacterium]|nr:hypothetical protein [Anaerolineaceae bacterium]
MNEQDQHRIQAFLQSITYKYQIENNAKIIKLPHITGIQFPGKSQQPWPRRFYYSLEFYVYDISPAEVKAQISDYLRLNPQEYVINVFSSNMSPVLTAYRNLGFLHAWTNTLMEYKLSTGKKHRPFPEGLEINQIKTIEDVSAVNALDPDYPTSALSLRSENIHNYMAAYQNEVCAKSQIITEHPKYGYIADMFTHANYRRKRISASLLHTMHKKAREKQSEYTLLVPSKMTRDIELYQRYGYQEAQPIAFLVPAKSPVELLNP